MEDDFTDRNPHKPIDYLNPYRADTNNSLVIAGDWEDQSTGAGTPPSQETNWRRELQRWLATLNPGRTPREYEKAVCYFFEVPGVPEDLTALSFDLLLAYRGALALRATPPARRSRQSQPQPAPLSSSRRLAGPSPHLLSGSAGFTTSSINSDDVNGETPFAQTPLAPATVNIRLTALRQFLTYCILHGSLSHLTTDQLHLALRRLSIQRRRPYQILAEPEWASFLAAADAHEERANSSTPWGVPRAARKSSTANPSKMSGTPPGIPPAAVARDEVEKHVASSISSKADLTGKRTARRDHALIALALATGLRAIELSLLDLGDLSREQHKGKEEWWLVLPDAKTKGQRGGRTLPLPASLMETVLAYVAATNRSWSNAADCATPLFLSMSAHQRLTPMHIGRIVDRVETQWLAQRSQEGEVGEVRAISPHTLRHSTAVALLEGNTTAGRPPASVEHVRGWLGHFDIRTTQGYLAHLDARRHRRRFALAPETSATSTGPAPVTEETDESER